MGEADSGWERGQMASSLSLEFKKGEDRGDRVGHRAFGACQTQATVASVCSQAEQSAPPSSGARRRNLPASVPLVPDAGNDAH